MLIVSLVAASLAALLHLYIFVMESFLWTTPRVRATFGITDDVQAEHTKPLAYNQGFYNLFLAIGGALGIVLMATDAHEAGFAIALFSVGSMLAAALVLVSTGRSRIRTASIQGAFPLLAIVFLLISLAV